MVRRDRYVGDAVEEHGILLGDLDLDGVFINGLDTRHLGLLAVVVVLAVHNVLQHLDAVRADILGAVQGEGGDDILGGEGLPVMPGDAFAEFERVGQAVRADGPALGQVRHDLVVDIQIGESAEGEAEISHPLAARHVEDVETRGHRCRGENHLLGRGRRSGRRLGRLRRFRRWRLPGLWLVQELWSVRAPWRLQALRWPQAACEWRPAPERAQVVRMRRAAS